MKHSLYKTKKPLDRSPAVVSLIFSFASNFKLLSRISSRIIEQRTIFIGSVRRSIAEPREILYYACKNMATSVIIIHNHPSGSPAPSENDLRFTEKMKRSCDDIGIVCLDHIIVGKYQYYSFREETDVL